MAHVPRQLGVGQLPQPVYPRRRRLDKYAYHTADHTNIVAWSTACPIDTFVTISQAGKAAGAFIMHRENGTLVELNASRAIGKMKATITQRFRGYDVDCDCRYIFFCVKEQHDWRIKYVKIIYEKDKLVPVDGKTPPTFSDEELARYPAGYRYLGAAQARTGHDINLQLATLEPPYWQVIYACMERWLAGEDDPGLAWETCET